jgi:cytochrome c oxidase subunit 3
MDIVAVETSNIRPEEWKIPSMRKVGMVCLILAEASLFVIFVTAYVFYIGKSTNGPYPKDVLSLPIVATICLLSSSFTIVHAEKMFHRKDDVGFRKWYEFIYHEGLTIATNLFGSTFYSLVGLHASHVVVGLILLSLVLTFSWLGKLHPRYTEKIEMISWYWHFVDAVWVVVFTVVYVIGV